MSKPTDASGSSLILCRRTADQLTGENRPSCIQNCRVCDAPVWVARMTLDLVPVDQETRIVCQPCARDPEALARAKEEGDLSGKEVDEIREAIRGYTFPS